MTSTATPLPPVCHPALARAVEGRRRRAFVLRSLLAVALLLVQLGALTHLVGHAGAAAAPRAAEAPRHDGDAGRSPALCLDCVALVGLDLPIGDGSTPLIVGVFSTAAPVSAPAAHAPAESLAARSRAPPPALR